MLKFYFSHAKETQRALQIDKTEKSLKNILQREYNHRLRCTDAV